ncbi:MAG: M48 family metallopeptidase [Clostridiales bacterium]|jgi:predicted metal-dependent hydrolase|nr:M48 family metallopeptidase [Clostridiales bacterium]
MPSRSFTFEVLLPDGNSLLVLVQKKPEIKNFNLSVRPRDGRIRLSVPVSVGNDAIKHFLISKAAWIEKRLTVSTNTVQPIKKSEYDKEVVSVFLSFVKERTAYWESVTNLASSAIRVKNMTSRYGSCNVKTKKITISLILIDKPPICLDYVIVHELTHLVTRFHDKTFYAHLERFFPNRKEAEKMLR